MATHTRVLFVDDEPHVLDGLRRLMRPMRDEWEMYFADGGAQALQLVDEHQPQVIVTDMRMPGMDGAALLNEVRRRHPRSVRIILSGHSERQSILQALGSTHQYLAKPCDPQVLVHAVRRSCALRAMLTATNLTDLISAVPSLPTLPRVYQQLHELVASPDGSVEAVARLIQRDPALTAKVLQLVNSSFFGIRRRITNAQQAVALLGLDLVRNLILSVMVFSQFDAAKLPGISLDALWSHCLRVGCFAKAIVTSEHGGGQLADDAFTAGLLHDIGKLILLANLPQRYAPILEQQAAPSQAHDLELTHLGGTHAQMGAYLLGLWGLPDTVVEAVAYHHNPACCLDRSMSLLTAVHAADAMDHQPGGPPPGVLAALDTEYLDAVGCRHRLHDWWSACQRLAAA